MYGYDEYNNITPEQLLQKIDQLDIFEFILKEPAMIGGVYNSPFREDKNPGCFLTKIDSKILFVDFADRKGITHRSCFKMVMDSYEPKLNLSQAIEVICEHFGLSKDSVNYKPARIDCTSHITEKKKTKIVYFPKPYNRTDVKYWNKFLISTDDLIEDNVRSVRRYVIQGRKGVTSRYPVGLCFAIDFISHVKLYMPHDHLRFISNCDENDVGNIDNIAEEGSVLVITKSYKDHRVIRNILDFQNVVWFMNEGATPDEYILVSLLKRFERVIIFFDNDFAGFKAAYKLYNILYLLSPHTPIRISYIPIQLTYKDAGELVYKEGRKDTYKLLTKILRI